ncbi:MAG: diguanylate cyclase, partial [Acidobacteria bacterium]|nr:diguanylate cyclase [Acidobacteriota bacterium]
IASAIYKYGPGQIGIMLERIETWMKQQGFTSIRDFIGKLNQVHIKNPVLFERAQFMKYFAT